MPRGHYQIAQPRDNGLIDSDGRTLELTEIEERLETLNEVTKFQTEFRRHGL